MEIKYDYEWYDVGVKELIDKTKKLVYEVKHNSTYEIHEEDFELLTEVETNLSKLVKQLEQPKCKTTQDEVSFTWYEIIGILSNKNHHLYDYMIRYFGELEDYDESPYIGDGKDKSFNYDLILCFDENCIEFNHLDKGVFDFKKDYLTVKQVFTLDKN